MLCACLGVGVRACACACAYARVCVCVFVHAHVSYVGKLACVQSSVSDSAFQLEFGSYLKM